MGRNISPVQKRYSNLTFESIGPLISYEDLSDNEESINIDNYLCFSSDEDDDLDNKLCLKKKKIKYSGKKAKLIKSIKDNNEKNRV